MKKKLTIIGLLGFTFLFGCTQTQDDVGIDEEGEFTVVTSGDYSGRGNITILKHEKTGCYYLAKNHVDYGGGLTVMMNRDGLPYCEEGSE